MHSSSRRTFWVITLSIFTMLMSNIAYSAPLMTFEMLSNNDSGHCPSMMVKRTSIAEHHSDASMTEMENCPSDSDITTNCCGSVCSVNFAVIPYINVTATPHTQRSEIEFSSTTPLTIQPKSLYRPPIA